MTDPTSTRRFRPAPTCLVYGLLAVQGLLWLSERYRWFWFNEKKGWTVLIGVAAAGVALLVMLLWFVVAVVFRRRFQFSIRSLLVLVVALALPCSWLAVEMRNAREQHEARRTITELGGIVHYDWEVDEDGYSLRGTNLLVPVRLANLLGPEFFGTTVQVHLINRPATDATLEHLSALPQLQFMALNGTRITDASLQRVKGLARLRMLWLDGTAITDTSLEYLGGVTTLQLLSLFETGVTDAGLAQLQKLAQLKVLDLGGTKVTDKGVKELRQALPHCRITRQIRPRVYKMLPMMMYNGYEIPGSDGYFIGSQ